MSRWTRLLLDVWREACQHIEIAESVGRIFAVAGRRLPAEVLLVRRFDRKRFCVETVGLGRGPSAAVPEQARNDCPPSEMERLLIWGRQNALARGTAGKLGLRLPGLVPAGLDGEVLAGPLNTPEGPAGAVLAAARPDTGFRTEHEALLEALREPLAVALENDRRLRELTVLREAVEADNRSLLTRLQRSDISDSVVGAETGLRAVMEQVELVSRSDVPVLILGETGSGKEVVARAIYKRSRRSAGPFLRINCGAIPPELIDSELFGHERGSFTGAVECRKGWFERADGGTLFLDECGELPAAAQVRLLRILQDGSFQRVGGERQLTVDVRIIAATHRDLPALVREGRFREDLWYRLAVFPIRLPPLRERREDIPALATHFALRAAQRLGIRALTPAPEDLALLTAYPWPGNVRELAAVLERAAILGEGQRLEVARALGPIEPAVPQARAAAPVPAPGDFPTLDQAMARHIEAALTRTQGRIEGPGGTACLLGINPHTLRARMRKLGVAWQRFRDRRPAS
jgi:transcriptional regulator with GAF, ATPase, and Fis domain